MKLYLSLAWVGVGGEHTVSFPARAWAELFALPDPDGLGARRIRDALTWLQAHHFIELVNREGWPSVVKLLNEAGDGQSYTVPGIALTTAKRLELSTVEHEYVKIPATFWTNGWMAECSGTALAMLLVLLSEQRGRDSSFWFSPAVADSRYALSEDTRSRGLAELRRLGLVHVRRQAIARDSFDWKRMRNTYELVLEALDEEVGSPEIQRLSVLRRYPITRGVGD